MIKEATFSEDRIYRYALSRIWKASKGQVCFVGLNPSTADENVDDPTIRRCIRYAERWGFGAIIMLNLFAFRATQIKNMLKAEEPIGPRNDAIISLLSDTCDITVMAWGNFGAYLERDKAVIPMLKNPHYLTITKMGQPGHPLYLKGSLGPRKWEGL